MTFTDEEQVRSLIQAAFGPAAGAAMTISDANEGRGVFSQVFRVELAETPKGGPDRVVVKIPALGPNGQAARQSGACHREALAYSKIVATSGVRTPIAHHVETDADGSAAFVLEDLGHFRAVDQLDGLTAEDGAAVAEELRRFHDEWPDGDRLAAFDIRRATPTTLVEDALRRGLAAVTTRWGNDIDDRAKQAFATMFERRSALIEAFATAADPCLCHGDPRADNLVFDNDERPVLFDWQQIAVQVGEADLAWLAATSFDIDRRRDADRALISAYGTTPDRYRLGLVLPGLTVLLLAQREVSDDRSIAFIRTTLQRIGAALVDYDVPLIDP